MSELFRRVTHMGKGRKDTCVVCGATEVEILALDRCAKCYRALERENKKDPNARADHDHEIQTKAFRSSQQKMVNALHQQEKLLRIFSEHAIASEAIVEDSDFVGQLTELLAPLMVWRNTTMPRHRRNNEPPSSLPLPFDNGENPAIANGYSKAPVTEPKVPEPKPKLKQYRLLGEPFPDPPLPQYMKDIPETPNAGYIVDAEFDPKPKKKAGKVKSPEAKRK